MRIWTLLENTACSPELQAEHGLSLYIETGDRKILFDTGQTDAFWHNAERMGLDLKQVDTVVVSHGHYDHGGGLMYFMEHNAQARIYVHKHAFGAFYNGTEKYIGLDPHLKHSPRLIRTEGDTSLGTGLMLSDCSGKQTLYPTNSYGLTVQKDGQFYPDAFMHEQYLLVEEQNRRILFSGCSHRGILNIVRWFYPDILIGGFHFKKLDPAGEGRQVLRQSADMLMALPTRYYTCHCTGTAQYDYLKTRMGDRLSYLSAGCRLEI